MTNTEDTNRVLKTDLPRDIIYDIEYDTDTSDLLWSVNWHIKHNKLHKDNVIASVP